MLCGPQTLRDTLESFINDDKPFELLLMLILITTGNPDTCEVFITTSTTTELVTTSTEWPLPDDYCDGIDSGKLPHPNDCTRYVLCFYGHHSIMPCPEDKVFHGESCVEGNFWERICFTT